MRIKRLSVSEVLMIIVYIINFRYKLWPIKSRNNFIDLKKSDYSVFNK